MLRTMLKSKIHRATVTDADLHYVGSVTVDQELLDAADLLEGEQVTIVDITNGARLTTYAIPGERGSGVIGINGAAAHLVEPGDLVILMSYAALDDAEARSHSATDRARRRGQPPGGGRDRPGRAGARRARPAAAAARGRPCRRYGPLMLLAIDVGNTNTVLGVFDGEKLVDSWRVNTDARITSDELALTLRGLLHGIEVTGIACCSTVPAVLREVRRMLERYYADIPTVLIQPGVRTGVSVLVDNPKEVGADRIMNTLAAHHVFGGPCIVVDFGTATNFDIVSERGDFIGSVLAPGIEISVDALAARAAQLVKVELVRPPTVIGKNTVSSLQSGIIFGFAGQVDGLVRRIVAELGAPATVVATGGLAPLVLDAAETIMFHEPDLTLIGLRLAWERNPH